MSARIGQCLKKLLELKKENKDFKLELQRLGMLILKEKQELIFKDITEGTGSKEKASRDKAYDSFSGERYNKALNSSLEECEGKASIAVMSDEELGKYYLDVFDKALYKQGDKRKEEKERYTGYNDRKMMVKEWLDKLLANKYMTALDSGKLEYKYLSSFDYVRNKLSDKLRELKCRPDEKGLERAITDLKALVVASKDKPTAISDEIKRLFDAYKLNAHVSDMPRGGKLTNPEEIEKYFRRKTKGMLVPNERMIEEELARLEHIMKAKFQYAKIENYGENAFESTSDALEFYEKRACQFIELGQGFYSWIVKKAKNEAGVKKSKGTCKFLGKKLLDQIDFVRGFLTYKLILTKSHPYFMEKVFAAKLPVLAEVEQALQTKSEKVKTWQDGLINKEFYDFLAQKISEDCQLEDSLEALSTLFVMYEGKGSTKKRKDEVFSPIRLLLENYKSTLD